jgi:hypothetical protein
MNSCESFLQTRLNLAAILVWISPGAVAPLNLAQSPTFQESKR